MLNGKPIGVFDSGVGGLSVVEEIFKQLPGARIIYVGDTARVPYGGRPAKELIAFADEITNFLIQSGAWGIIDACNSTSAVALDYLQEKYVNPIIGVVEPGVKAALQVTKNNRIGLIATEATVKSGAHIRFAKLLNPNVHIYSLACPDFVPLVEAGEVTGDRTKSIVKKALKPLMCLGIDTLILGCTHYPYLAPVIKDVLGTDINLVDPAIETVKEAGKMIFNGHYRSFCPEADDQYFVTGDPAHFKTVGDMLIKNSLPIIRKVVL
ncbi:MAG: glutamate racemase [Bacillota bacterium]